MPENYGFDHLLVISGLPRWDELENYNLLSFIGFEKHVWRKNWSTLLNESDWVAEMVE